MLVRTAEGYSTCQDSLPHTKRIGQDEELVAEGGCIGKLLRVGWGLSNVFLWNVHGVGNFFNCQPDEWEFLRQFDVVCLTETWSVGDFQLPSLLGDYSCFYSPALKVVPKGRPSGGLAILVRRDPRVQATVFLKSGMCLGLDLSFTGVKKKIN